ESEPSPIGQWLKARRLRSAGSQLPGSSPLAVPRPPADTGKSIPTVPPAARLPPMLFYVLRARSAQLLLVALFASFSIAAVAQDDSLGIAKASKEPELAIKGFKPATGLSIELVAAEPNVANPVAFCFDEQGRIYV